MPQEHSKNTHFLTLGFMLMASDGISRSVLCIFKHSRTHSDTLASLTVYLAVSLTGQRCRPKKSCQAERIWHIGKYVHTLTCLSILAFS